MSCFSQKKRIPYRRRSTPPCIHEKEIAWASLVVEHTDPFSFVLRFYTVADMASVVSMASWLATRPVASL